MKSEVTFVIPVRFDSEERQQNLHAVLRHLRTTGCRTVILEASPAPSFELDGHEDTMDYIHVTDTKETFHRTHYINRLLRMVRTDIVGVWDADVLTDHAQIAEAIRQIHDGSVIAYPYNGQFVMLSEQASASVRRNLDLETLRSRRLKPFLGRKQCGGAFLVNREAYLGCGGENERFTGWGPEDAERMHRVRILGHHVSWTAAGQLYHLYHPRGMNSGYCNEEEADRLRRELIKVCCMDRETLKKYILE